jgi:hypothetical protein
MACAWGIFGGYAVSMLLSFFIGQKKYPIAYPLKEIGIYALLTIALFCCSIVTARMNVWIQLVINTILFLLFCAYILKKDLPLASIPGLRRFAKK